jgi:glycosyltransferase involved in cell wall biosynthesis
MRILHVMRELRPSGAEVMLRLAAPVWINGGCELHVLSTTTELGSYAEELKAAGYVIHHSPLIKGKHLPTSLNCYRRVISKINPDIVHVHGEGLNLFTCGVALLSGYPCFRTVHNNFLFEGRVRFQKRIERAMLRALGCKTIAISNSVQKNEIERFLNPSILWRNWFDTEHFFPPSADERAMARASLGLKQSAFVIVSIGNGSCVKNYSAVISAIAEMDDPSMLYLQVGHEYKVDRDLANELGVSKSVVFCGPQSNIRSFLWAADLYVMPSLFEGFGLAAAEAIATGIPCVLAACPGLLDFRSMGLKITWAKPETKSVKEAIAAVRAAATPKIQEMNSMIVREAFAVERLALYYLKGWKEATRNPT